MRRPLRRPQWSIVALLVAANTVAWAGLERQAECVRVTELLDALIQPRFRKDGGVFGMRRVVKSPGHEEVGALTDLTPWDKKQLARIQALKHDYRVSMLRVKHPPGKYRRDQGPLAAAEGDFPVGAFKGGKGLTAPVLYEMIGPQLGDRHSEPIRKAAIAALPQMTREGSASRSAGPWLVTLRPVRATQKSCVACHQGAKQGDTLGVLVYAVSQDRQASTSSGSNHLQPRRN